MDYINIILLSNDWDNYHRKAYTEELIRKLNKWSFVLLTQLPVSIFIHTFTNFRKKIIGLVSGKYRTYEIEKNSYMFTPVILFHYLLWKHKIFFAIDNFLINMQLNRYIKNKFGEKKIILWYYFPYLLRYVKKSKADIKIYDQYDIHHLDPDGKNDIELEAMNKNLIEISDLVFCTTEYLYNMTKLINPRAYYVTNGNNFEILSEKPVEKAKLKLPIENAKSIGYLGGIRDWIDFELLNYAISQMQNINFIFIGSVYRTANNELEKIKSFKNVLLVNYVKPELLPLYLSHFDVGLIPFRTSDFFKCVFPNKFFEYLAAGIPVVTTNLPELKKYENIIGYSYNKEDFLKNCELALNGFYSKYTSEYRSISKENSWSEKAKKVSDTILSNI